jgi:hypothetical protein
MNAVVLSAALSGANASLYVASRMLFSLARGGFAPAALGQLTAAGAPRNAIAVSATGILVAVAAQTFAPEAAYLYIIGASLFGGMLRGGWRWPRTYDSERVCRAKTSRGCRCDRPAGRWRHNWDSSCWRSRSRRRGGWTSRGSRSSAEDRTCSCLPPRTSLFSEPGVEKPRPEPVRCGALRRRCS